MQSSKVIILISTEVSFQSIACRALLRLDNGTVDGHNDDFFIDSSDVRAINIFVSKFLLPRVTKSTAENNTQSLTLPIQTTDFFFLHIFIILLSLQQRSSGIPTTSQSHSEEQSSSSKKFLFNLKWSKSTVMEKSWTEFLDRKPSTENYIIHLRTSQK